MKKIAGTTSKGSGTGGQTGGDASDGSVTGGEATLQQRHLNSGEWMMCF